MRKFPSRPRLEVDRAQVIRIGKHIEAQMEKEWFQEFLKYVQNQQQAIVNAWRDGFVAKDGKTIGEVSERYAGKLEVFGLVKAWFNQQVSLAKKYEQEQAKKEAKGKTS